MSKIKVTQVKSGIDRMARQKRTLVALGLRRMLHTIEVEATPQILGMVNAVHHLVKVEDANGRILTQSDFVSGAGL
jgi:large subunit ribosomal protein L30